MRNLPPEIAAVLGDLSVLLKEMGQDQLTKEEVTFLLKNAPTTLANASTPNVAASTTAPESSPEKPKKEDSPAKLKNEDSPTKLQKTEKTDSRIRRALSLSFKSKNAQDLEFKISELENTQCNEVQTNCKRDSY